MKYNTKINDLHRHWSEKMCSLITISKDLVKSFEKRVQFLMCFASRLDPTVDSSPLRCSSAHTPPSGCIGCSILQGYESLSTAEFMQTWKSWKWHVNNFFKYFSNAWIYVWVLFWDWRNTLEHCKRQMLRNYVLSSRKLDISLNCCNS